MRRVLTGLQVALFMLLAPVISYASDLDIAKKALRDNLWEIARIRAEKNDSVESKIVILESYAREGKWNEILKLLDLWIVPNDDAFVFYRFLAKAKSNNTFDIDEVLSKYNYTDIIIPYISKSLWTYIIGMLELTNGVMLISDLQSNNIMFIDGQLRH